MSGALLSSGNALADTENTNDLMCPPPEADFIFDTTRFCDSVVAKFIDQSTGTITTWEWDFGDGEDSTLQSPDTIYHTYYTPGIYMVTLIVTGPYGADTVSKPVTATFLPYHTKGFVSYPDSGSAPLRVYFFDR